MLYLLPTFIVLLWLGPFTSSGVTAAPLATNPTQPDHLSLPQPAVHERATTPFQPDANTKRLDTSIESDDDPASVVGSFPKRSNARTESDDTVAEVGSLP